MSAARSGKRDVRETVRTCLGRQLRLCGLLFFSFQPIDPLDEQEDTECHDQKVQYDVDELSVSQYWNAGFLSHGECRVLAAF